MRITDALLGEHGMLYAVFDHVEAELNAGGDPSPYVALVDAVLRSHADAEDEILFEEMSLGTGGAGGPAAVMIGEHREVARLLDLAREADAHEVAPLLLDAIRLARSHFRREEAAAFPMAEELFDDARLRKMGADWGVRRDVRVRGSHER